MQDNDPSAFMSTLYARLRHRSVLSSSYSKLAGFSSLEQRIAAAAALSWLVLYAAYQWFH